MCAVSVQIVSRQHSVALFILRASTGSVRCLQPHVCVCVELQDSQLCTFTPSTSSLSHTRTRTHPRTQPLQHRLFPAMLSMKSVQLRASIQPMLWIVPRCVSGRRGQLDDIPAHSRRESE